MRISDWSSDVCSSDLQLDPGVRNNLSLRVARLVRGDLRREIRTIGKISRIDPTARRNLAPPIAGTLLFIPDTQEGDRATSGELFFTIGYDERFALKADYLAERIHGMSHQDPHM